MAADAVLLLAPYAAALPRWLGLGVAGALLLGVGATYEQRLRDLGGLASATARWTDSAGHRRRGQAARVRLDPAALRSRLPDELDDRLVGLRDLTVWETRAGRALVRAASWLAAHLGPHLAVLAMVVAAGAVVTALTGASAEIYESVSDRDGVAGLDRPVLDALMVLRSEPASTVVTAYTDLGGQVGMPVLTVLAVVAMTVAWRQWTPVLLVTVAAAGSLAMTVVGKAVVGRSRPPMMDAVPPFEDSPAFPSGHALNAVVIAGVIAYLLLRRQSRAWVRATTIGVATAFALTMGLSRVYLGHHWLTDVLVAWTLGLAWLTVVVVAHRLLLTFHRHGHTLRHHGPDDAVGPGGTAA